MKCYNKYTSLNQNSTKKDITEAFFNAGMYIKPCYSVDPITNDCSCGDDECQTQGKHPVLPNSAGFYDIAKYENWLSNNPSHCTVAFGVGYNKGLKRSFVVIDIDNMKHLDRMLELIPCLNDTFQVKTKKGMHYYFWFDQHDDTGKPVWVKTKLKLDGMDVDVLAQGHACVIAPGSVNKWIVNSSEIKTLTMNEVLKLNSMPSSSKIYSNSYKKEINPIVIKFYAGLVQEGERNAAMCAVSSKQLWDNQSAINAGIYTCQDHINWLVKTIPSYIKNPHGVRKITSTAKGMFSKFNPTKFMKSASPEAASNNVFNKIEDEYSLDTLKLILQCRYQVIGSVPSSDASLYTNMVRDSSQGIAIKDIMSDIKEQLNIAGAKPIHLKVQEVVALLKTYHPELKSKRLDKIIDGKRIQQKVWNLTVASVSECSSDPVPHTNMVRDLEDTNKIEGSNPEPSNLDWFFNDKEVTINEQIIEEEKWADSIQEKLSNHIPTTQLLRHPAASIERLNQSDDQSPIFAIGSIVEPSIIHDPVLYELFKDLL